VDGEKLDVVLKRAASVCSHTEGWIGSRVVHLWWDFGISSGPIFGSLEFLGCLLNAASCCNTTVALKRVVAEYCIFVPAAV
jgi:hypothetical protein